MQKFRTLPMLFALFGAVCALASGHSLYAAVDSAPAAGATAIDVVADAGLVALPDQPAGVAMPQEIAQGVSLPAFRPGTPELRKLGGPQRYKVHDPFPAASATSNGVAKTVHFLSQFYGHAPSGTHALPGQRQEMHGRSLHLRVRF